MSLLILSFCLAVLLFGFVLFFGAPYLPTLKKQKEAALDLLDLRPGQTLLELGSGDGRVLKAAAKRGLNSVGYELNPLLVVFSWFSTLRYRKQVKIIWGNYWTQQWPRTDGIFVFLLNKYMVKLDKKITQQYERPVKLVSFAFSIPKKKPIAKQAGLYLYMYPKSSSQNTFSTATTPR